MKRTFLFATIASILSINAFADPATITTQDYVDTTVATKQDKISGAGTVTIGSGSMSKPTSVVTDTDTDGVVAKRFILAGGTGGWMGTSEGMGARLASGGLVNYIVSGVGGYYGVSESDIKPGIVTAEVLDKAFADTNSRISAKQPKKVCVEWLDGEQETDENCLLWNLP